MDNFEILQMIPLQDNKLLFFGDSIIALALVQNADGKQQLVYIEHDRETGRPVIKAEPMPPHQQ